MLLLLTLLSYSKYYTTFLRTFESTCGITQMRAIHNDCANSDSCWPRPSQGIWLPSQRTLALRELRRTDDLVSPEPHGLCEAVFLSATSRNVRGLPDDVHSPPQPSGYPTLAIRQGTHPRRVPLNPCGDGRHLRPGVCVCPSPLGLGPLRQGRKSSPCPQHWP